MAKTIQFKNLIIREIERPLHLLEANGLRIGHSVLTWFTTNEMSDERPSVISKPIVGSLHQVLVSVDQGGPVPMQVVRVLQKDLLDPCLSVCNEETDQGRLVVSFEVVRAA